MIFSFFSFFYFFTFFIFFPFCSLLVSPLCFPLQYPVVVPQVDGSKSSGQTLSGRSPRAFFYMVFSILSVFVHCFLNIFIIFFFFQCVHHFFMHQTVSRFQICLLQWLLSHGFFRYFLHVFSISHCFFNVLIIFH